MDRQRAFTLPTLSRGQKGSSLSTDKPTVLLEGTHIFRKPGGMFPVLGFLNENEH